VNQFSLQPFCEIVPLPACFCVAGVLYEWDTFQVGVKMQMDQGSQCKMIFYYGNKDASQTLSNLSVSFDNTPSMSLRHFVTLVNSSRLFLF
jgi:hypothetical protein